MNEFPTHDLIDMFNKMNIDYKSKNKNIYKKINYYVKK